MPPSPLAPTLEKKRDGSAPLPHSRPLRVLHLNSGNIMGGVESMLLTLAEYAHLCPELKQSFALTFDDVFAARLRTSGATVHLLPQVRLRQLPSIYQSRRELRALLQASAFDVVVSHSPWIQAIFGDVVRGCGIPLVFWMHNEFNGHWLQRLASFHPPDFTICNSVFTRSTLERIYPRVRSTVLHYPVRALAPSKTREDIRIQLGIEPDEVVILSAARMEAWKGHHNLVRAAAKISTSIPWRVLIAGAANSPANSRYLESLQREAAQSPAADRIQFVGFRSDVPDLMSACDIHCQPNEKPEPFGIVFVEALQAGVPVVTYAMGGPREILDSSTGILVGPGDSNSIADALTTLIENRALRVELGSAGPARAATLCDPAQQMRRLTQTLRTVVECGQAVTVA
jgi:glycosyltransferase involved in cell wall biosynthesis